MIKPAGRLCRIVAILAAALLPAGCGELPHPFRHSGLGPALARPHDARAIAVTPLSGPGGRGLDRAMVKALARRQIPAELGSGLPGGDRLVIRISPAGTDIAIDWVLAGPHGEVRHGDRLLVPAALWRSAPPEQFAALADRAVATLFPRNIPPPPSSSPHGPRTARVLPLPHLPGDGATALVRALRRDLRADGIAMVADGGDYLVQGHVSVLYDRAGGEHLAVAWVVENGNGHPLGTVRQGGPIPPGGLPQHWGKLADEIAAGGADGILRVIKETPAPLQSR